MKAKLNTVLMAAAISAAVVSFACCSAGRKLSGIRSSMPTAQIALSDNLANLPPRTGNIANESDTLVVRSLDGKELIVMRAIRDDDGQMVANQVLEAAKVTARFRNTAERHGKVTLEFQIIVPPELRSSQWQLRYHPTLYIMEDSLELDRLIVTGKEYRRLQMRGYQQYERFLRRIIDDSTRFINRTALEIFIRRNIPQLYAFKTDSSYVSDEAFYSIFGVTEQEAVEHYTDKFAVEMNSRRRNSRQSRFNRYVKVPLTGEGVRLDTVVVDEDGDFLYNYSQTITTRPRLKKVDVTVDGEIFQQDKLLCLIGRSEPLNFYISSVSAFVDDTEKYITKIIERRVESNCTYRIDFAQGRSEINPLFGSNESTLNEIRDNLRELMTNSIFALDSITVCAHASPEGNNAFNRTLAQKRSKSICRHFNNFISNIRDSLKEEKGFSVEVGNDLDGKIIRNEQDEAILFKDTPSGENWERLDCLVDESESIGSMDKDLYNGLKSMADLDKREAAMRKMKSFNIIRDELYPQLRCVDFAFHLHRKGMVKDTVQTTELDTVYMAGIQAIKDRDYDKAIEILRPYQDYNTAVAYCAKDFNHSALAILENCPKTAPVNYMMALLESRLGHTKKAVELYLRSCQQEDRFIHRGNLDPEISSLIRTYNLEEQLLRNDELPN